MKGKFTTVIIVIATLILAGVAIFTAVRLYQLKTQPVAPTAPTSKPRAQEVSTCSLSFSLTTTSTPTATPTGTATSTPTSTATPTATPTSTPTSTPAKTSSPTPTASAPSLPNSGTSWPTLVGIGIGVFVIIGSLLLAL